MFLPRGDTFGRFEVKTSENLGGGSCAPPPPPPPPPLLRVITLGTNSQRTPHCPTYPCVIFLAVPSGVVDPSPCRHDVIEDHRSSPSNGGWREMRRGRVGEQFMIRIFPESAIPSLNRPLIPVLPLSFAEAKFMIYLMRSHLHSYQTVLQTNLDICTFLKTQFSHICNPRPTGLVHAVGKGPEASTSQ